MMIERTDDAGRWTSDDDGVSWSLVEPSQAWLDGRAAETDPEPLDAAAADAAVVLAALISELAAISPTSTSAQVRTALINARNAAAQAITP